jgi:hypothetical protein
MPDLCPDDTVDCDVGLRETGAPVPLRADPRRPAQ